MGKFKACPSSTQMRNWGTTCAIKVQHLPVGKSPTRRMKTKLSLKVANAPSSWSSSQVHLCQLERSLDFVASPSQNTLLQPCSASNVQDMGISPRTAGRNFAARYFLGTTPTRTVHHATNPDVRIAMAHILHRTGCQKEKGSYTCPQCRANTRESSCTTQTAVKPRSCPFNPLTVPSNDPLF